MLLHPTNLYWFPVGESYDVHRCRATGNQRYVLEARNHTIMRLTRCYMWYWSVLVCCRTVSYIGHNIWSNGPRWRCVKSAVYDKRFCITVCEHITTSFNIFLNKQNYMIISTIYFNITKVEITKTMIKQGILFCPLCESKQSQNGSVGGHLI